MNIISKRQDGYHNLETTLYPVGWNDVLEIVPSDKTQFTSTGIHIPGNLEDNLCIKAYNLLCQDFKLPAVHIHLHKIVPIGAGLGGGSADAAFTMKNLNDQFQMQLTESALISYAKKLGSDCAFFIKNVPSLAIEKGDEFLDIEIDLKGKFLVLVYPALHVSTAEAYGGIKPIANIRSISDLVKMPIESWKDNLKNDFESFLFEKYPQLSHIKDKLYEAGAIYSSMSGSGSTIYGIFNQEVNLKHSFSQEYLIWQGWMQ